MESLYKIKVEDTHLSVIIHDKPYSANTTDTADPIRHPATLHEHPIFEMFFIREGTIEFHTESESVQHGNSVVIIPPHLKHRTVPMTRDTVCVFFSPIRKDPRETDIEGALLNAFQNKIHVMEITEEDRFYISHVMQSDNAEDIRHLFSLLFASLLRRLLPRERTHDSRPNHYVKYINTVETFLHNRCYEKVHLSDLAQTLSLSEKQTARLLKRLFGCTLSQLIHRHRMDSAIAMLRYTDLDIREIAIELGYEYENYFYTVFRNHYGITPIEYRKAHLYAAPLDGKEEK